MSKNVEYIIKHPKEEGYSDVEGYYYACKGCGVDYIDTEECQEWSFCPYCGGKITAWGTLNCLNCEYSEWDGDEYICGKSGSPKEYEGLTDNVDFGGCKSYNPKEI